MQHHVRSSLLRMTNVDARSSNTRFNIANNECFLSLSALKILVLGSPYALAVLFTRLFMKPRQAIFLQEMGITRWQVRKPALFKAEQTLKQLNLSHCELLVVCSEEDKKHPLMPLIIRAFGLDRDNVKFCSLEQFEQQQGTLPHLIWSTIGTITTSTSQVLASPSLSQLAKQGSDKKSLWEQFCAYQQ